MLISFSSPTVRPGSIPTNTKAKQQGLLFSAKPKADRYKGIPVDQKELLKDIEQQALTLHTLGSTDTLRSLNGVNGNRSVHQPTVDRVFNKNGKLLDPKGIIQSAKEMCDEAFGNGSTVAISAALGWLKESLDLITKAPRKPKIETPQVEYERKIFPEELPSSVGKSGLAARRGAREVRKVRAMRQNGGQNNTRIAGHLQAQTTEQSNAIKDLKDAFNYQQNHTNDPAADESLKKAQKKFRKSFNIPEPRKKKESQVVMIGQQEIPIS